MACFPVSGPMQRFLGVGCVGILSLVNRLGLGADRQYPRYRMGTKPFMYFIYITLKMSLEKTIETYNKK
jgi:hypothetical protein